MESMKVTVVPPSPAVYYSACELCCSAATAQLPSWSQRANLNRIRCQNMLCPPTDQPIIPARDAPQKTSSE